MIKKILPLSIFVLVFILVILVVLQLILNRGTSQGSATITPTLFQGRPGSYSPPQTGKKEPSPSQVGGKTSPTIQSIDPAEFRKKLPIITSDFTLDYSSRMQRYVVTLKTDQGQVGYDQWLTQNQSYEPLLDAGGTIIARQSVEELHGALDYAENNKLTSEQEFKKSTDTILFIINTLFSPISSPQQPIVIPTSVPSPTPSPVSTPVPSPVIVPSSTPPSPSPTERPLSSPIPSTNTTLTPIGAVSNTLLPNPLAPISVKALNFKKSTDACLTNRSVYETASSRTGIPWEILAAIHYIEGSCGVNQSLVSGRVIGKNEPDIVRSGGCSSKVTGPGIPTPLPAGGCGFYTLLDSAIYAGNHLKGKLKRVPSNFTELVRAFSLYNGTGNSNCNGTPYTFCPKLFNGEDDAYVMNMFDERHETMYLVYCADSTKCNPPRLFTRPGVATVIRLVTNQL